MSFRKPVVLAQQPQGPRFTWNLVAQIGSFQRFLWTILET
jgi:hypothetical protein